MFYFYAIAGTFLVVGALYVLARVSFRRKLYDYHGCRVPSPKNDWEVYFCLDCPKIYSTTYSTITTNSGKYASLWREISEEEILYYPLKKEELWTSG